jgi:hypothetical protein
LEGLRDNRAALSRFNNNTYGHDLEDRLGSLPFNHRLTPATIATSANSSIIRTALVVETRAL